MHEINNKLIVLWHRNHISVNELLYLKRKNYQEFEITPEVQYEVQPLRILDHREKVLRNKTIPLVKVMWKNHIAEEATWELESEMQKKYP